MLHADVPHVVDFFLLLNSFINSGTGWSFFRADRVDDVVRVGTVPLRSLEDDLGCKNVIGKLQTWQIQLVTCAAFTLAVSPRALNMF